MNEREKETNKEIKKETNKESKKERKKKERKKYIFLFPDFLEKLSVQHTISLEI